MKLDTGKLTLMQNLMQLHGELFKKSRENKPLWLWAPQPLEK